MTALKATLAPFVGRIMEALPSLLFGLLILVAGYLLAALGGRAAGRIARRTTVDRRIADLLGLRPPGGAAAVETVIGRLTFWLIMLFVFVGFFSQIGLPLVAEPLRAAIERVLAAGPRLLEAALILVVAWVIAALLRLLVTRATEGAGLEDRLRRVVALEGVEAGTLGRRLGTLVFYLALLFALPAFLAALGQAPVVEPLVRMLDVVLTYLPHVLGAAVTIGVGWVVARIVREIVRNVLAAAGLDGAAERAGLTVGVDLRPSSLVATVVYFVVWIPFIVSGLEALRLEAVSGPAVAALNAILTWVPRALGGAVLLVLAWVLSRFLGGVVSQLLRGVGFDTWPARLGLGPAAEVAGRTWSDVAGLAVSAFVLLFALVETLEVLGLSQLAAFGDRLVRFGVNVVIAGVIVGFGLWVGGYVAGLLQAGLERAGARQPRLVALAARSAVVIFAGAMALQQIGFGETIVVNAFTLLFGAVCLALALAFGLGARDVAGRAVERVLEEGRPPTATGA